MLTHDKTKITLDMTYVNSNIIPANTGHDTCMVPCLPATGIDCGGRVRFGSFPMNAIALWHMLTRDMALANT